MTIRADDFRAFEVLFSDGWVGVLLHLDGNTWRPVYTGPARGLRYTAAMDTLRAYQGRRPTADKA